MAPSRADRLALRLAKWTRRGSYHQLGAEAVLVDLLLSPPGGWAAFLRRQVLVPADAFAGLLGTGPGARAWSRSRGR